MRADVLVRSGLDIGLGSLVGSKPAFINATRSFLVGDQDVPFSSGEVVIEILEDVPRDDDVVLGCRHLVEKGYHLALDDYLWQGDGDPLLRLASIVKLDILALTPLQLAEGPSTRAFVGGPPATLLEPVPTPVEQGNRRISRAGSHSE